MSRVVQEALRAALEGKANELSQEVHGAAQRYRNERDSGNVLAKNNFLTRLKRLIATYETEAAEIDTALQRDRDADR